MSRDESHAGQGYRCANAAACRPFDLLLGGAAASEAHRQSYLLPPAPAGMASYTSLVAASHKKFKADLKAARTRQAVNKAYTDHKKEHEQLLKDHLKEEKEAAEKAKAKIK